MMGIRDIVSLLGGLGLFLYGMNTMGDGLEKSTGKGLQRIIEALTGNVVKGVLVGLVVTALIQSSSATTVMAVGFVNSGVMTLTQAVGIIFGANIGTTVTAQILRLSDIQGVGILSFFKTDFLAPAAIAVGAGFVMFGKNKRIKNLGQIFMGFGILFIGMDVMEESVSGIKDKPWIGAAFSSMGKIPVLGIAAGTVITALLQSSSASVGILQALAAGGVISVASAVPIILGQNIGTCVTAIISGIGAEKNAKRTAAVHLMFNVLGVFLATVVVYGFNSIAGIPGWNDQITRGGIADFHTVFNLLNALVLLPFNKLLVRMAYIFVPEKSDTDNTPHNLLEERLLQTPSVAIGQCVRMLIFLMKTALDNYRNSTGMIFDNGRHISDKLERVSETEEIIDKGESELTQYLVRVSEKDLSAGENNTVSGMFHIITDVERIGDCSVNISEIAEYMYEVSATFSDDAAEKLKNMMSAVDEVIRLCIRAYEDDDIESAQRIQPLEAVVDVMRTDLRQYHINSLVGQRYDFRLGVAFLDIVNNLERISDHCSNIGMAAEQRLRAATFDPHEYTKNPDIINTPEYKRLYNEYKTKYCN